MTVGRYGRSSGTYLISLVVVLRIVLENLRLLGVLERADQFIGSELLPPLLAFNEPGNDPNVSLLLHWSLGAVPPVRQR